MSDFVLPWIFIALVFFWALGAYNRLLHLQTLCKMGFVALEGLLSQYVLIVTNIKEPIQVGPSQAEDSHGENLVSDAWLALTEKTTNFNTLLQAAHAQPWNDATQSALTTALTALDIGWRQLHDLPPDLTGPAVPETVQQQWDALGKQVDGSRAAFNQQVLDFNVAIAQFPAFLLARVLGFKAAQPI